MQTILRIALIAILLSVPAGAFGQLRAVLVADGLQKPVSFAQNPADASMQLVAEHRGRLRVLLGGQLLAAPFLDISSEVGSGGELGLLGVAFAPDYATSGRLFVSFINVDGHSVVSRFVRSADNPLAADPNSRFDFRWPDGNTWIEQPFNTHKGGDLQFGPDGYLYLGLGDGGASSDPMHLAQQPWSLLGKMLRLDVSVGDDDPEGYNVPGSNPFVGVGGVLGEIWAFGLRNPWRFSFDSGTGAMFVADVGQDAWEEINHEPAGAGGRNYGWRNREAAHDHVTSEAPFSEWLTDPLFEYDHIEGRSVTGGFVYRGSSVPSLTGRYVFADFVSRRIISLGLAIGEDGSASVTDVIDHSAQLGPATPGISAFGVDAAGELYVLTYGGGRIYRISPSTDTPTTPPSSTGQCSTPDPFAEIGGGTCYNGGWLPPGMAPPGGDAPTTEPPTTPSSTPCVGADPFGAMGGGTCVNGEWLPPGHPGIPIAPTTPPPTTPATPPEEPPTTPPTTPPPSACSTPDPFASMGGGTCYNGDWLPPGYPVPEGTPPTSGPTPPSEPPPSPPPPAGGCTTPDPFEVLGGGTCVGGEWLPPGFPGVD